ncbi:hypothetical protein RHGRI_010260 [Rhododendron griersonianum]|uniref:Uncharacterized protein n=1 Tax=Rhododendron griersonianum TaxID=479676 RepID=A0AAV6KHX8_9ERIC|nr:hypothetical protein RHGRI_010260 [Rhododendron griersonianum]
MRRLMSDRFLQLHHGQMLYEEYRRNLESKRLSRDNLDLSYSFPSNKNYTIAAIENSRNTSLRLFGSSRSSFESQQTNKDLSISHSSCSNYYDGYEIAEEEGDRLELGDKEEAGDEEAGGEEECPSANMLEQQFYLDGGATNEVILCEDENIAISYQVQELKGEESHELVHIISQHVNTSLNIELCEPHGVSSEERIECSLPHLHFDRSRL